MLFPFKSKKLDRNVVVFTTHKAGSMVLHGVLRDICEHNGVPYYSPNQSGAQKMPFDRIFNGDDFIAGRKGCCFGALRFFVPSAAYNEASILLHLRDPRDVLTSMYYSYCFMHPAKYPGEIEPNTGYRKAVADAGIDKFVLDMSSESFVEYKGDYGTGGNFGENIGNIGQRYHTYLREVISKPNAVTVSYEEMVLDFGNWLKKVISAFGLKDPDKTYSLIMRRYAETVKPEDEDARAHKRKVTPGDYREKLQPDTIVELNRRFREVLDQLGYSSPSYEVNHIPIARVQ